MRVWLLAAAGVAALVVLYILLHAPLTARAAGDLIAVALVVFWLGVPWVGLVLTARPGITRGREPPRR